jgi:hypothetical protein
VFIYPTPKPAVLTAITILSEAFGEWAFVSAKMPKREIPDRFIVVSRIGGGPDSLATDQPRMLVECFAKDVGEVEAMSGQAHAALSNASGTTVTTDLGRVFVRKWDNATIADYPYPDLLDWERWQIHGELSLKLN